jgi:uncharacterized protein (UPF0262 family)
VSTQRIIEIRLDERSILKRNADIAREREVAIRDLIASNCFDVEGHCGPFRVGLRVDDGRLTIDVAGESGDALEAIRIPLGRFRRPIRDYFTICDSYFRALRGNGPKGVEAIDMARRALHNEAAELVTECLAGRVHVDFETARRLFTLICVLHIRQASAVVDSPGAGHSTVGR